MADAKGDHSVTSVFHDRQVAPGPTGPGPLGEGDGNATRRCLRTGELAELLGRVTCWESTGRAYRVAVDDLLHAFVGTAEADGMTAAQVDRSARLILEAWKSLQPPSA
jgi:hypothetical protein